MKAKDIFKLAVRILGLVFLYNGLQVLPAAVEQFMSSFPRQTPDASTQMDFTRLFSSIIMAGWPLLVAWWLVKGAPHLMRIAYPDTASARTEEHTGEAVGHKA